MHRCFVLRQTKLLQFTISSKKGTETVLRTFARFVFLEIFDPFTVAVQLSFYRREFVCPRFTRADRRLPESIIECVP